MLLLGFSRIIFRDGGTGDYMEQDLQQAFYILYGAYIAYLLLPVFIAAGLLLAALMTLARYWRPVEKVEISGRDE